MNYPSLLYASPAENAATDASVFEDVKLINLVGGEILPAMSVPLGRGNILARQECFRELENGEFRARMRGLLDRISTVKFYDERWRGASCAAERQCAFVCLLQAVSEFAHAAAALDGRSELTARFTAFFAEEVEKPYFRRFEADTAAVRPRIDELSKHLFLITGEDLRIGVNPPEAFVERIARCAADLGVSSGRDGGEAPRALSPVIVEAAVSLYPDAMKEIARFCEDNQKVYDDGILAYHLALSFYLKMTEIFDRVRKADIPLCYATVSDVRQVEVRDAYDITLMTKDEMKIIPNDIHFTEEEPFFYLTGANGGGKTTYLRAVAVTMLMFLSGCPIAARSAEIYPPQSLFTHFPRDERFDRIGRFEDEERRVNDILDRMGPTSMVLLNETYSTTSEESAVELTSRLAEKLYGSGIYGIYITHQHGIGETRIPYLNVVVDADDANRRTYKVARRRNDQGSLALDVLRRYRLTGEALAERFPG